MCPWGWGRKCAASEPRQESLPLGCSGSLDLPSAQAEGSREGRSRERPLNLTTKTAPGNTRTTDAPPGPDPEVGAPAHVLSRPGPRGRGRKSPRPGFCAGAKQSFRGQLPLRRTRELLLCWPSACHRFEAELQEPYADKTGEKSPFLRPLYQDLAR